MSLFEVSMIASISGTFLSVVMYIYLYFIYRERYIGIWILSWFCYFIRLNILDSTFDFWQSELNYFALLSSSIANALLFAWGTHVFVGKRLSPRWMYVAVITSIISYIAVVSDVSFEVKSLPAALLFGGMFIWSGIMICRYIEGNSGGKWITGLSLVLLGVHGIDFAFLRAVEWFAPWGYLIDTSLRASIAIGTILVYFDKTRRELSYKEESYRLLAENALDVIFRYRLSPNPGYEYISPSIVAITGYLPEEFYEDANLIASIIHPEDLVIYETFLRSPEAFGSQTLTVRLIRKNDHQNIWIEQKGALTHAGISKVRRIEGVIRDITIRKQMEQEMLRFDRLNTIGQMAASLAHEIRNPMTTVRGYLQFLSSRKEYSNHKEQFSLMIEELDRGNSIIREYLSMSRDKVSDLRICQLNKIIEAMFPLIQADANASNVQVQLILNDIPSMYLDENEIRQMLLNLVRNGIEAMSPGCTLTIRTFIKDGDVVLAVQDQGLGIPADILANLGTPFITTKEMGTGLGLPVCYKIALRHQAKLKIDTGSLGTTVAIYFKPADEQLNS